MSNAEHEMHPLDWWRTNQRHYPMLANVARICLGCPGSQIECERVFSLCGLTISLLRNRVTNDNLAQVVYITKNTCPGTTLEEILGKANGTTNTSLFLNQRDADNTNRMPNAPMNEIDLYGETDTDSHEGDHEPEHDPDDIVIETPYDWQEVIELDAHNNADDDSSGI